ncbi:MAG: zinc-ribbon domain-containing protein [Candidatus Bathyarchaeia archaeon]
MKATFCPSCKKQNDAHARYCINCGTILNSVYCSVCGTKNPEDLGKCLECGNILPKLGEVRWAPTVRIIHPTSAMTEEKA